MRRADLLIGVLLLVGAVVYGAVSFSFPNYGHEAGPGPGLMPLLLSIALAVLSLLLIAGALMAKGPDRSFMPDREGSRRFGWLFLSLAAMFIVVEVTGMLVGIFLFLLVVLRKIEPFPWGQALGVAISTPLVVYLLFQVWLKVPLPTSILGFQE